MPNDNQMTFEETEQAFVDLERLAKNLATSADNQALFLCGPAVQGVAEALAEMSARALSMSDEEMQAAADRATEEMAQRVSDCAGRLVREGLGAALSRQEKRA